MPEASPLFQRLRELERRHHRQVLATLATLVVLMFIGVQASPTFSSWIARSDVLPYATFLLLIDVTAYVMSLGLTPSLQARRHQDAAMRDLAEAAQKCHREEAELLEYAGLTTLPLIRELCESGANIKILVKHPDTVTGHQLQRTISTLDTWYTSMFVDYRGSFECRCYRAPYSLRARLLGRHLLELGWLTPDIPRETTFGYNNPSIIIDPARREHSHFVEFFRRTFDNLWLAPDSEDGRVVLKRFQEQLLLQHDPQSS